MIEFLALLRALARHGVDFVVVGGVAAILEGAPIHTRDLDVVYATDGTNLQRLLAALVELGASYRDPAGREIAPTLERLATLRMSLMRTRAGQLDVLREIAPGWSYAQVLERSRPVAVHELELRVLALTAVVESKVAADRDKDRAVLPVLRNTLAVRQARGLS